MPSVGFHVPYIFSIELNVTDRKKFIFSFVIRSQHDSAKRVTARNGDVGYKEDGVPHTEYSTLFRGQDTFSSCLLARVTGNMFHNSDNIPQAWQAKRVDTHLFKKRINRA